MPLAIRSYVLALQLYILVSYVCGDVCRDALYKLEGCIAVCARRTSERCLVLTCFRKYLGISLLRLDWSKYSFHTICLSELIERLKEYY